jgi:RNA polymerase sigma-70 factor, ECF subfamily
MKTLRSKATMRDEQEARLLIRAAKGGDRAAFDRIVRAYFPRIYAALFRLVGNHEDAEDLSQEVFVRAYSSLSSFREEAPLGAWLMRIAVFLSRDHHRRSGRGVVVLGLEDVAHEPASQGMEPAREMSRRELLQGIGESIDRLPHHLRAPLVLRVIEGLDYEEVARATGMRVGTARTQVMKARKMLVRLMAPWIGRNVR